MIFQQNNNIVPPVGSRLQSMPRAQPRAFRDFQSHRDPGSRLRDRADRPAEVMAVRDALYRGAV